MWNLRWNDCGKLTTIDRKKQPSGRAKRRRKKNKRPKPVVDYAERGEILGRLGYGSYAEYLASPLWAKIRRRVFGRDGSRCRVCRQPGEEVHHRSYDEATLLGESLRWLLLVCSMCHEEIEFDGTRKRDAQEAAATANAMLRERFMEVDMEAEFLRLYRTSANPLR